MAVSALIKLSQGALVPPAGEALAGVDGVPVTVENGDNTDVQSWRITIVYVPPGSAVPIALLAESAASSTPLGVFLPDSIPGCYRIQLFVWPQPGFVGTPGIDIRNFAVPEPNFGFIFPPYQELPRKLPVLGSGLPGEKPDEMNFGGQPYGWDGIGNDGLLLEFMRTLSQGGIPNFSYFDIPISGITIPEGQEMFVDQLITGPGLLTVHGLVKSPPKGPPPKKVISPPVLTVDVDDYAPSGFSTATDVYIASTGPVVIGGMQDNPLVKEKRLINNGAGTWSLGHQTASSSFGAQFLLPAAIPLPVSPGNVVTIFRDQPSGQWRGYA